MTIGYSGIVCGVLYVGLMIVSPLLPQVQLTRVQAVPQIDAAIPPEKLNRFLARTPAIIVDVRLKEDCGTFSFKSCPGCLVVRLGTSLGTTQSEDEGVMAGEDLQARALEHPALRTAHKDKTPVVVMCCKGVRSEIAQRVLASAGFNAAHVPEGMLSNKFPNSMFLGVRPLEATVHEQ